MNVLDLDFSKPIYTKLADGIHQVRFTKVELWLIKADTTHPAADIEFQITGQEPVVKGTRPPEHLQVTNDLEGLMHDQADCVDFYWSILNPNYFNLNTRRADTRQRIEQLLADTAPFGYVLWGACNHIVGRYVWNGYEPVIIDYVEMKNSTMVLRYDLLQKQWIIPNQSRQIAGVWQKPRYYNTAEECQRDNAIKVFTF